jgi:hypothetical protein
MKKAFVIAGICLSVTAGAIGRSGNGTVSSSRTGFYAQLPAGFDSGVEIVGEKFRIRSLINDVRPGMVIRSFIELSDLDQTLPGLAELNRAQVSEKAKSLGWMPRPPSDPCVDAYFRHEEDGDLAVAFWGAGKGLVMIGPHSPYVRIGEKEILDSLHLEAGACAW